jgi:hypothetical protein
VRETFVQKKKKMYKTLKGACSLERNFFFIGVLILHYTQTSSCVIKLAVREIFTVKLEIYGVK